MSDPDTMKLFELLGYLSPQQLWESAEPAAACSRGV